MKKIYLWLVIIISVLMLGACSQPQEVILPEQVDMDEEEEPLVEDAVITVGDKSVSRDEIMFYMLCIREQYEGYFGKEIWDVSFGDKTFLDMCKDDVLSEIVQLKVITQKAEEDGITVSEDEAEEIADTVLQQMEEIQEADKVKYNITTELLEKIYHDNYLSSKMFDVVTANVNTDVTDEEARVARFEVLTLHFDEENRQDVLLKADELWQQASAEGADFYSIATVYSDIPQIEYAVHTGEMENAFDRAAFVLKEGEISRVILGKENCYIVKCILEMDEDDTASNKEDIINDRQTAAFKTIYEGWAREFGVKVDEDKWAQINMDNE